MNRIGKARNAIMAATNGERGVTGSIGCPNCEGTLFYSVAGFNGHSGESATREGVVAGLSRGWKRAGPAARPVLLY